ncbi:MAG TPA: apolipoprotein N-acyltransferase [Candidatus Hydrogenedens sp.]|nr:apolipoprotein N-acyltransferase [Candidatus Hydrogenedens sp.]HOL18701.1 apolipoprotein N-acyltransferase [Candidatus Hydrogenedens sp.]HPP58502.1 apolipoprotein N-acyltransferase [Candidatus Hydrogenedens sp.]
MNINLIKTWVKNPLFLSILTGILAFLSFPNFHFYILIWVAFVPLFITFFLETKPKKVALYFFISGWVFHSLTLNWLIVNMFWVGGPAFIGYQLLSMGLSAFWAIIGFLVSKHFSHQNSIFRNYVFGALWVGMEWVQAHALTGFGWCNLGYSQGPNLLFSQLTSLGSVPLLSFFIILANIFIAEAIIQKTHRLKSIIHVVCVILVVHFIGWLLLLNTSIKEGTTRVAIIQPNFPQEMKFDPIWYRDMVEWAVQYSNTLLKNQKVDIVFWPEALVMTDYSTPGILDLLQDFAQKQSVHLITGTTRLDEEGGDYNSCVWINPEGNVMDYYDKVHLAPFGEYLPLAQFLPFLRNILPYDVSSGKEQKIFSINEHNKIGPLICFEVLFSNMAHHLRKNGATALVVLTNLSWFGGTNALPQELEICRMRAIETRLPVIHCTNTGISGIFDPHGKFYVAHILIGRDKTYLFEPILNNPGISVRARLGGIFTLPCPSERISSFLNPDYVSMMVGILGILFLLIDTFIRNRNKGGTTTYVS